MPAASPAVPVFIKPMQPTAGPLPEGEEWLYELKLDGFGSLGVKRASKVWRYSRNGHDLTPRFPSAARQIERLRCRNVVLDG
jgi:bifunctional non-homologous end joining protein LigD